MKGLKVSHLLKCRSSRSFCNSNVLFSNLPPTTVYGGPRTPEKRITLSDIAKKYNSGIPLTMVTAYDYPSAVHVDKAGIDILLVGDSLGMVVLGYDTTLPVSMGDMLSACKAVARGAQRPFLVGDLPFGSYELGPEKALESCLTLIKEGGMDAVKLEGGQAKRVNTAAFLCDSGIAVMGHVGLTPQAIGVMGGFKPQGRTAEAAFEVVKRAKELESAGCFAIVLECVPPLVGAAVTAAVKVPIIGIGAGPYTSGQVLVYHDLLGMMTHPHHEKVAPKFCKRYANVGTLIHEALNTYREEVETRSFPSLTSHSPYTMPTGEDAKLVELLKKNKMNEISDKVDEVLSKINKNKK